MKKFLSILLVLTMIFTCATPVFANQTESAEAFVNVEASENESYMLNIVLFALDEKTAADTLADKLTELGISSIEPIITDENGNAVAIGSKKEVWYRAYTNKDVNEAIELLTALDGVVCAEPEYIYTPDTHGLPKEYSSSRDWAIKKQLQPHKNGKDWFWWYEEFGHTFAPGSGVVVAVIDTGVDYTHEDLASNMWVNTAELYGTAGVDDDLNGYIDDIYGVDVTATGKKAGNPMDDHGHGTHVAGIIGMSANNEGGIGLAYGAKIMAVKAGQSTGSLSSTHIAKAIKYAHMMGADVINMSFGGIGKSELVEAALEDAFSDCVLVASAGNDGIPTTDADPAIYPRRADFYPAAYSFVLGVMATDENGNLASFSNWDYLPNANAEYELTAPGKNIYSTLPGNRYAKWSGTSMAAPFVSAAAAIVRSHYSDKDTYSSRFIMGQLSSATTEVTKYYSKDGYYSYPALSVYDSIYYLPKPNLMLKDSFLMDTVTDGEVNDGDGIIDAGEVIDLGVLVRNQWGMTGEITVTADAISRGGVENPWIEFITDEITLEPAGTFQEVNNSYIYDDSFLAGVGNPIKFRVSSEAPNDTEIKINITITTTNGIDENDDTIYEVESSYTFRVQAGRGISGTLTEDTTLTNDYLWIVESSILIPEGITLTIEPGTKVQFYSSDYEDAYGGKTIANINCVGTLKAIGTEDEPIEMYPGAGFEEYCVEIGGEGLEILEYCNIINPKFGLDSNSSCVNQVNHCNLIQNYNNVYYRKFLNGKLATISTSLYIYVAELKNSTLKNVRKGNENCEFNAEKIENCLFDSCSIVLGKPLLAPYGSIIQTNNVYVGINGNKSSDFGEWGVDYSPIRRSNSASVTSSIYTYNAKKYFTVKATTTADSNSFYLWNYYSCIAKKLGGSLLVMNDAEEEAFIKGRLSGYIGAIINPTTNQLEWIEDSDYPLDTDSFTRNLWDDPFGEFFGKVNNGRNIHAYGMIIEVPATLSDEDIIAGVKNFDHDAFIKECYNLFTNNAVLNPVLNNDPNTWATLVAESFNADAAVNYAYNNYWGTENKTLINKMITDADDYAGTYQDIIEDPILTLESESLADIYPFVTKVYLTDEDGNIVSSATPGEAYNVHVHFNRDMDTDTNPLVSYGGDTPYTDYTVDGEFVSAREWVGATRISPVLTGGTMYFRTKGGCAADDKWLVCGEDILRFSFNISSTSGVLAMLLSAEGGANKVELSWAQNDYETLAGYNLYRSTKEDSGFTKINLSVLTDTEYTDTDVLPGVTYYYYFKVVNTDGVEEDNVSNTASAAPIDNIFPVLKHSAVTSAKAGSQITISATATDNIAVTEVKLYYKTGNGEYKSKTMTEGATTGLYVAVIPASAVTKDGVSYYLTAEDADGNISYSGTKELPNAVYVNAEPYISGITPSKVAISGGKTVTVLGGNFTSDMVLKVGGNIINEVSFVDGGQITFIAPANASGSYAVTLTAPDGKVITSPASLAYTDASSMAQIPTTMTLISGIPYTIPLYISASGDVISLHAEIDIPSADFTSVKVEKADASASFNLDYTYSGGVLKIGCIGASNINSGDGAIVNIIVTPKVTEDKQYDISLHDVYFNDVEVTNVISGQMQLMPSYPINATVKYYTGNNVYIEGVTITAAGVSEVTDENGTASLTVSKKNVTVTASKQTPEYSVSAYDASLVLQSAIGKITLDDNQKLAADVDGNGRVSEYDAALILQMAVKKIDSFPIGVAWVFAPSYIDKALATTGNSVAFTAISLGDVDGSYAGEE